MATRSWGIFETAGPRYVSVGGTREHSDGVCRFSLRQRSFPGHGRRHTRFTADVIMGVERKQTCNGGFSPNCPALQGCPPGSLTSQAIPFRWADQGVASNATTECPTLLPGAWADPLAGYLLRSARNQRGAFFVELMVIGTAPSSSAYSSIERVTQSGISAPQCFIHRLSRCVKRPADERTRGRLLTPCSCRMHRTRI